MAYRNVDEYLIRLEQAGLVKEIQEPVESISQIQSNYNEHRVLWLTGIMNTPLTAATHLFSTEQQMAWALGVESIGELESKLNDLLHVDFAGGPASIMAQGGKFIGALRSAGLFGQTKVSRPATYLPLPDCALIPFLQPITAHRPLFGQLTSSVDQNAAQRTSAAALATIDDDEHQFALRMINAIECSHEAVPVAFVLGGDPALIWAANMPMPPWVEPHWIAGWIRRKSTPMMTAQSQPLTVPANAEAIIEGVLHTKRSMKGYFPLEITAAYYREGAVIPILQPDTYWIIKANERVFLPIARLLLPNLHDINLSHHVGDAKIAIASLDRPYRPDVTMHGLWATDQMADVTTLIIIDQSINPHDLMQVAEALTNHVNWMTDLTIIQSNNHTRYSINATALSTINEPSTSLSAHLSQPHIVWNNQFVMIPVSNDTPKHALLHSIWQHHPNHHILLVNEETDLQNTNHIFHDGIKYVDWRHDITIQSQPSASPRIAIDATY